MGKFGRRPDRNRRGNVAGDAECEMRMTIEAFKKHRATKPFQPFAVHLADGRWLAIKHPEHVAMSQSGRTVAILDLEVDAFETVDLLVVTSLKPLNGNGKKRRR